MKKITNPECVTLAKSFGVACVQYKHMTSASGRNLYTHMSTIRTSMYPINAPQGSYVPVMTPPTLGLPTSVQGQYPATGNMTSHMKSRVECGKVVDNIATVVHEREQQYTERGQQHTEREQQHTEREQ
eukprot:1674352-Rhodomonas_salina.1